MNTLNEYKSRDFYLSACLLASGIPLIRLDRTSGPAYSFVFEGSTEKINEIIADHWSKKLLLPTKVIIDAINELKTRLHNGV